jgi:hypothetical protein
MERNSSSQVIAVIYKSTKVLILLNLPTNLVTSTLQPYDISQIPLVKTYKSITGVLCLLDSDYETVLKFYQPLVPGGEVSGVIFKNFAEGL